LDQEEAIERQTRAFGPIVRFEDNVTIEPHDFPASTRQRAQCQIQKPLFLPQDIRATQLQENFGVMFLQLEFWTIAQFNGDERHGEVLAKNAIICDLATITDGIEETRDGPKIVPLLLHRRFREVHFFAKAA
jgi:hypothetical protein